MKKILLCFITTLLMASVYGQVSQFALAREKYEDQSYSKTFDDSIPALTKYDNAKVWIAKTFGDYSKVVQYEDSEKCRLILKASAPIENVYTRDATNQYTTTWFSTLHFTLTIDCKNEKFRLKFEDMKCEVSYSKNTPLGKMQSDGSVIMPLSEYMNKEEGFQRAFGSALASIVNSAHKSITTIEEDF